VAAPCGLFMSTNPTPAGMYRAYFHNPPGETVKGNPPLSK